MSTVTGSGMVGMVGMIGMVVATLARAAWAAEEPTQPRHASVEIDTSDIGEEGPVVKRRVRERTDVVLRAAGVLPARPDATDLMIYVDVDALQGEEPGYRFELWVSRGGELVGERQSMECTLCTESEIVERVEATVANALEQLETQDLGTDAAEPEPEPEPLPTATPMDQPRRRLSGLGKGGVAMLVVGAAGLGTGAVLAALPPKVKADDPLYETTTRPPGFVTLGVGAAAVVSGVVMLVVDRRRGRAGTISLAPTPSTTGATVVLRGRF